MLLLCFTYVRGPDFKAGFHFSNRAQVGEFQLGLVCVGISEGNQSRQSGSARVGTRVPTLPRASRSTSVSGETVKGTSVRAVEAHPRGGGRVVVTAVRSSRIKGPKLTLDLPKD